MGGRGGGLSNHHPRKAGEAPVQALQEIPSRAPPTREGFPGRASPWRAQEETGQEGGEGGSQELATNPGGGPACQSLLYRLPDGG